MNLKEIATVIVFLLFTLPFLIKFLFWTTISTTNPCLENIEKGAELIVESVVPWWVGVIEWLTGLPGIVAAFLIIGFIFFLKWIGEIR